MVGANLLANDQSLFLTLGVGDEYLEHETVHLGFGKGISTFLLNGVLCRHDKEWVGQAEGLLPDGHLVLLHGFQQCALYLGWGTVDFVGEDEVREDRTFLYLEVLFPLAIHQRPYDVRW